MGEMIHRISIECPKCGKTCKLKASEYEDSLGSFECVCGLMGLIEKTVLTDNNEERIVH